MHILWIKTGPLLPVDTGGRKRTYSMLREISRQHEIHYLSLLETSQELHREEENDSYAATKQWISWHETSKQSPLLAIDLTRNLFSSLPYALAKYRSNQMAREIERLDRNGGFDLIICDFLFPGINFLPLAQRRTPAILFQHNVEAEIWRRLAESKNSLVSRLYFGLQARRMATWEERLSQHFDGIITVSEHDASLCRSRYRLGNVLGHVPTGVDLGGFKPRILDDTATEAPLIGFLGSMDWQANIDAVRWFLAEIWPGILREFPQARFRVIGRNPPAWLVQRSKSDPSLEVTGTVPDIRPPAMECDLMVVPLRAGSGTRLKILECMAMGLPVVSTTIGAEGLPFTSGKELLLADDVSSFLTTSIQILHQPALARAIASNAWLKIESEHSWQTATAEFLRLCAQCLPSYST